jgi:hypothetical protein
VCTVLLYKHTNIGGFGVEQITKIQDSTRACGQRMKFGPYITTEKAGLWVHFSFHWAQLERTHRRKIFYRPGSLRSARWVVGRPSLAVSCIRSA